MLVVDVCDKVTQERCESVGTNVRDRIVDLGSANDFKIISHPYY